MNLTDDEKKEILDLVRLGRDTVLSELVDNPRGYTLPEMIRLNRYLAGLIKKLRENF